MAKPSFDSAFKEMGLGGGVDGGGVSVSFLQFCITACLVRGAALSALKMSEFGLFRVLRHGQVEMRQRFKGACLLFHPGDHMQSG